MNCPHCLENLPPDYSSPWCPYCGKNLGAPIPLKQELPPVKFRWRLFLCALLLPVFLTLISAATMRFLILSRPANEGVSPMIALIAGAIGGVICGVMMGFQTGGNLLLRVVLSILMSAIMIAVCITLCFFGCNFGGYQFRID